MAEETRRSSNSLGFEIPTNPLDEFDNVTYNIKLYMIPPTEDITESKTDDTEGDARSDNGGEVTSRGGFLNGAYTASPEKTVVLAQTGVTGTLIDNVELMTVPSGKGGKITQKISCTIKQPGAATFFDMIVLGRRRLGIPPLSGRGVDGAPFFFEINFQGYRESGDGFESDDGGQIRHIAGPYRYKALLQTADFSLDSTGTTYNLTFAIADDIAYADVYYKTPTTMTTVGETISEHIEDFTKQWNHYNSNIAGDTKAEVDQVEFKLDNLVGKKTESETPTPGDVVDLPTGNSIISDEKLDRGLDSTATPVTEKNEGETIYDAPEENEGSEKEPVNPETEKIKIEVPRGTTVDTYIGMLLARNKNFTDGITRTIVEKDGKMTYDGTKTNIFDYKINARVKQVKYDEQRQGFSKLIIFEPAVFRTPSGKCFAVKDELKPTADEITRRVQSMEIKRAYEYIFTGRNDQILNIDIKYDLGINFLIPPEGQRFGSAVLNNISNFSTDPAKTGEPLTGKALAQVGNFLQDAKKFFNFFKAAKDGSIRDIARAAGFDENQIKTVIADRTSVEAQALVNSLSNRSISEAIVKELTPKGASNQSGIATESDRQRQIENSLEDYTPEASGYVYGQDVLSPETAYTDTPGLDIDVARYKIDPITTGMTQASDDLARAHGHEMTNPGTEEAYVDHMTYSGGPATNSQTLFGYMYGQKDTADILYNLDMVIRGDPWYLGEPDTGGTNYEKVPKVEDEKSSDLGVKTYGGDNFILFELRQPQYFDPFVNDEDLNSGMYPIGKQSYFITGIYRIIELVSSFDNGRFTVNVRTAKELTLDLSVIKKDEFTLDDVKNQFDATLRIKAAMEAEGHNTEDDKKRFDDPEYTQRVLDFGPGSTIEELIDSGLISSSQLAAYNAWNANKSSATQGKRGDF